MRRSPPWPCFLLLVLAVGVFLGGRSAPVPARGADKPEPAAVERARSTVQMLDDLYKAYVVTITATYVEARESQPAAKVTKKVFEHMDKKGWHKGRLVDATGKPLNPGNRPKTDFEKQAIEAIKGGKAYFDEVGTREGKPVLRAATIVPVVMKQCILCHPGRKEGELLGAIVYEVPIK